MRIEISPKVKAYLNKKKSNVITVDKISTKVCWGGSALPEVTIKAPKEIDLKKFDLYEIEGINVYIRRTIDLKEVVNFSLSSFGFFKSVSVRGIEWN